MLMKAWCPFWPYSICQLRSIRWTTVSFLHICVTCLAYLAKLLNGFRRIYVTDSSLSMWTVGSLHRIYFIIGFLKVVSWALFSFLCTSSHCLNLLRTILSSKSLSLHRAFNLQYILWKTVCQTSRPGCWKTNLNLTMIKQRPSSCAHLPSSFQSPNLLPSLSLAVKHPFLLLPEILVFTSEMTCA